MKCYQLLLALALALAAGCGSTTQEAEEAERQQMLSIESSTVRIPIDVEVAEISSGDKIEFQSGGSGTVVATDEEGDRSLVLTAWHVCRGFEVGDEVKSWWWTFRMTRVSAKVQTVSSQLLDYKIVAEDRDHDLCVLETSGYAGPAVTIRQGELPGRKSRIQAAGYPGGIWSRQGAYIEDGRFVSRYTEEMKYKLKMSDREPSVMQDFLYWTVPAIGGISGGGVYYRGELFSVFVAGSWEHAGYGPDTKCVRRIVDAVVEGRGY